MTIITGCLIEQNGCILMVKEAKKSCFGKWNFPAGHLEEQESLLEGAIRETLEETGCRVKLTGMLPIVTQLIHGETHLLFHFTAQLLESSDRFHSNEILESKWIPISEIKKMGAEELREVDTNQMILHSYESGKIYPLEIIQPREL